MSEEITITKREYERLNDDALWLQCLEAAGVDNWPGIDYAHELFNEARSEELDEEEA